MRLPRRFDARRVNAERIPLALAFLALLAALVGGIGPAEKQQATYSWPPADLPAAKPERQWYTPLLLIRRSPATLDVSIPCRGTRALPRASEPLTLVATARRPAESGGLAITRSGRRFDFSVGGSTFATAGVPEPGAVDGCTIDLHVDRDRWSLRESEDVSEGDFGVTRPVVTGFFSAADLSAGARPSVELTTEPFGTDPTPVQEIAWIVAALLAAVALATVAGARRPRATSRRLRARASAVARALRPVDAFVGATLLVWWIFAPVLYDDGWVKVRQANYEISGGFSHYYTSYGVNLPLEYWLEWLQHWIIADSETLLVLRLPALVALAGTWIVSRWIFTRVTADSRAPLSGAEWTLGLAFLVTALSWDMTLRHEPAIAFLVVSSLACAVRFLERPSAVPLIVGGFVVVLAVTAHPVGLIALAPLIVVSPHIVRWARATGWLVPVAIGLSILALGLVVAAVGSDLFQRASDARGIREYGDAVRGWREELNRYTDAQNTTSLQRESVALIYVALVAFFVGRMRAARPLLGLPAASLALALVLMIPTPSKWVWHFGAFAGLTAVALAAELVRLREQESSRWSVVPFIAVGIAVLLAAWAWSPRIGWSDLDLRTLDWTLGVEERVSAVRLASALVIAGAATVMLVELGRRGWAQRARVPWSVLPWLLPLAVLPVIVFTVAVFAADTAKTPAWTVGRQNLESLRGASGCGLAEDTSVAVPSSFAALPAVVSQRRSEAAEPWTPATPVPGLQRFSLLARGTSNVATTPWYRIPPRPERVGFFLSPPLTTGEAIEVRWGRLASRQVAAGGFEQVTQPLPETDQTRTIAWTLLPEKTLHGRPPEAELVQLRVRSDVRPPRALAVTGAVSYRSTTLEQLIRQPGARALVWPNLVLYLPCRTMPRLEHGIVEVPTLTVSRSGLLFIEIPTNPFSGLIDLYRLRDLSVGDSEVEPVGMHVYWVERDIPGTALAPAERVATT